MWTRTENVTWEIQFRIRIRLPEAASPTRDEDYTAGVTSSFESRCGPPRGPGLWPWEPTCSLGSWGWSRQSPPAPQPPERIAVAPSPLNCQSAAPPTACSLSFHLRQKNQLVSPDWRPRSCHQTFQTCFSPLPGTAEQSRPLTRAGAGQTLQDTPVTHLSAKSPNQIAFVPLGCFPAAAVRRLAGVAFIPHLRIHGLSFPGRKITRHLNATLTMNATLVVRLFYSNSLLGFHLQRNNYCALWLRTAASVERIPLIIFLRVTRGAAVRRGPPVGVTCC